MHSLPSVNVQRALNLIDSKDKSIFLGQSNNFCHMLSKHCEQLSYIKNKILSHRVNK